MDNDIAIKQMKKEKDLVSVIIPTYKRPDKLRRSIDSVLQQTYDNIEILVIDDNPPKSNYRKETQDVISEYIRSTSLKYVKHDRNRGAPAARNTGIYEATGKYISFLDDDDEYILNKTELQVKKFEESVYKNLGIVYGGTVYKDENGRVVRYGRTGIKGNALKYHLVRNISITSGMLIKRSCLLEVGGFSPLVCGQEYELILKILKKGYEVDFIEDEILIVHLHKEERISTSMAIIEGKEKIYQFKREYFILLTQKEIREVNHKHYLSLFREYILLKDKTTAFQCYRKALINKPASIENFIEIGAFVFPYNVIISFKSLLHKIKRIFAH